VRLTESIALIGGPEAGVHGDVADCNVYAIETTGGTVLVDSGVGRGIDHLLETAATDGIKHDSIVALLLTHAHLDHAGGAHLLQDRLGVEVIASPETARRVEQADEASISLPEARRAGMYRPTDALHPCQVNRVVRDGDQFPLGTVGFRVIETPGHSDDHIAYLAKIDGRMVLISGDLLFPGGAVALLNTRDCSLQSLVRSLERLRELEFDMLLAGHLPPTLEDAERDRDMAIAALDALAIPRSIV
jgi:glyoxylase-like metal-dependent hydrolase (beta-lactamase superfamily II)